MSKTAIEVVIYTKDNCGYCVKAKKLLNELKEYRISELKIKEIKVPTEASKEDIQQRVDESDGLKVTVKTVPQIFFDNLYVGGYDELREYTTAL